MPLFNKAWILCLLSTAAFAQSGPDPVWVCNLATSSTLDQAKTFRVVQLDSNGNGNKKAALGTGTLSSSTFLGATLTPSGDIAEFVIAGVRVPMPVLTSPGIAVQMGVKNVDNHTRDVIKMYAVRSGASYQIHVRTITSAGAIMNPTRDDTWTLAKDKSGNWRFVIPSVSPGSEPRYATTITANLTPKDKNDDSKGFKGISGYAFSDTGAPPVPTQVTQSVQEEIEAAR